MLNDKAAETTRAIMSMQNKTVTELAKVLGVSVHTAGAKRNGRIPFNLSEIDTVANWLGIDPMFLFTGISVPEAA